jgi:hypothetical protein
VNWVTLGSSGADAYWQSAQQKVADLSGIQPADVTGALNRQTESFGRHAAADQALSMRA